MAGGRPTKYTPELADRICQLVATHPIGLPRLCKMYDELPSYETINVWRWEKPGFADKYTQAKSRQAEMMVESIEDVAVELLNNAYVDEHGAKKLDGGLVGQARIVVDSRKWMASKLAPKIYGDRKELEQVQHENETIKAELAKLRAELSEKNRREF